MDLKSENILLLMDTRLKSHFVYWVQFWDKLEAKNPSVELIILLCRALDNSSIQMSTDVIWKRLMGLRLAFIKRN